VARARVAECRATEAVCEWIGEVPALADRPAGGALVAVPTGLGDGEQALAVAVSGEDVARALAGIAWLLPVTQPSVDCEYRLEEPGDAWRLLARDGATVWRGDSGDLDERTITGLDAAARDEVKFRRLWRLAAAAGRGALPVAARFFAPSERQCDDAHRAYRQRDGDSQLQQFSPVVVPDADATELSVQLRSFAVQQAGAGDLLGLELSIDSRQVHVALFNLDLANRRVKLDYPTIGQDNMLRPEAPLRRFFWVGAPEVADWPGEQPCRDRYLAIATREYVDFTVLETDRPVGRGADAADLLGQLAGSDWGIAVVDLVISRQR